MANVISDLTASSATISDNGKDSVLLTCTVTDKDSGKAASAVEVTWKVTGGSGKVDSQTSQTNEKGIATNNLKVVDNKDGTITIQATTADDTTGKSTQVEALKLLEAPSVTNATESDNYRLDHEDIEFGVQALVPTYETAQANDKITFHWGDAGKLEFLINNPIDDLPKTIDVKKDLPAECLTDGKYNVFYEATDAAGNVATSESLLITVFDGGNTEPTLDEPVIKKNSSGAYINVDDANKKVQLVIPKYEGQTVGDVVTYYWKGFDKKDKEVSGSSVSDVHVIADTDNGFTVTIDKSVLFPINNRGYEGYVNAYYSVVKANVESSELSYTKKVLVDTVPPHYEEK